jgi:hypothetical protein
MALQLALFEVIFLKHFRAAVFLKGSRGAKDKQ